MVERRREVLVIGIGNVLWADEGFGVRAVEALHEAFAFPDGVVLMDGGTQGLNLLEDVACSRRVLVFDAVDYRLAPGTLAVLRDYAVPAWGRSKLSPHQTGFNDVLAHAALQGRGPERITVIGVQPEVLDDFGGSLRPGVRARLREAGERGGPGDRRSATRTGWWAGTTSASGGRPRPTRAGSRWRGRESPADPRSSSPGSGNRPGGSTCSSRSRAGSWTPASRGYASTPMASMRAASASSSRRRCSRSSGSAMRARPPMSTSEATRAGCRTAQPSASRAPIE